MVLENLFELCVMSLRLFSRSGDCCFNRFSSVLMKLMGLLKVCIFFLCMELC